MQRFARLCDALERAGNAELQLAALRAYFADAPPDDAGVAAWLLAGARPGQSLGRSPLRAAAMRAAGIPRWLFDASRRAVGDFAETIALVLPAPRRVSADGLAWWIRERVLPLPRLDRDEAQARLRDDWSSLDADGRLVYTRLVAGTFRPRVSTALVARALAQARGVDSKQVTVRLADAKSRRFDAFYDFMRPLDEDAAGHASPYPSVESEVLTSPDALGSPTDWIADWDMRGIRAQLVRRHERTWLWLPDGDLATSRFADLVARASSLPNDTVLDGVIVPASHSAAQKGEAIFVASDLLEFRGADLREVAYAERRRALAQLLEAVDGEAPHLASPMAAATWAALDALRMQARGRGAAGLVLRHRDARYRRDDPRAAWRFWATEPLRAAAVLIYAERTTPKGYDLRAYTFAAWDSRDGERCLTPIAKIAAPVDDDLRSAIDAIVRKTTIERFGPVRSVRPSLVCELAFAAVEPSARHKSGLSLRDARIVRRLPDASIDDAATLESLHALRDAHRER